MSDWNISFLALVIWREASDQPLAVKLGVGCVVRNRVKADKIGSNRWTEIISERLQFSSITSPGDPNLIRWPMDGDQSWVDSMNIAASVYSGLAIDNTGGANLYANLSVCNPEWAHTATETARLGAMTFFAGTGVV